jgi:hypothetical protein
MDAYGDGWFRDPMRFDADFRVGDINDLTNEHACI